MNVFDILANRRKLVEDEVNLMISCYRGTNPTAITALGDKIIHMCLNIGCPNSVLPMIESLIKGKVKMWATGLGSYGRRGKISETGKQLHGYNTGRIHRTWSKDDYLQGHFRWDYKGHMLTREDRDFLKAFFIDGVKKMADKAASNLCGIIARHIHIYEVSDNLIRMEVTTPKNNEYAFYYYKDKNQLQANFLTEIVTGEEKKKVMKLIDEKFNTKFANKN